MSLTPNDIEPSPDELAKFQHVWVKSRFESEELDIKFVEMSKM